MTTAESILFQPIRVGEIELPNRIVMASMSRARTENPELVPIPLQADYYRQRASAGLIFSEGTWPSREAIGAIHVPGLFSEQQVEGWKRITHAVHEAGGRIFVQIGHLGAASHPSLLNGEAPLAPSVVGLNIQVVTPTGFQTSALPRAMTLGDIARTIGDYAKVTRMAQKAEFDGVELHAAFGYLVPEFLNERFNLRKDRYGGCIANRARFPLEILEAMISEWRPGRIGVKLSPRVTHADLRPTDQTLPTYEYLISRISELKIAYLQLVDMPADLTGSPVAALQNGSAQYFRPFYEGLIIANGGLNKETAEQVILSGAADLAAFGVPYLSNPDLVERFKRNIPLAPNAPRETWYAGGAKGYADYPHAVQ